MEFKTSQGGETTLVFDGAETDTINFLAQCHHLPAPEVVARLTRQRQADPLADFQALVDAAFPPGLSTQAGLVPAKQGKKPKVDPLVDLENLIRRRISAQQLPTGPTSNSQQAEAMLLNALATCLLAQTMRDLNAG